MPTNQKAATAFAEGFVKECAARGLSREQAEEAWDKLAFGTGMGSGMQQYHANRGQQESFDPWTVLRGVGDIQRGITGGIGRFGSWLGSGGGGYLPEVGQGISAGLTEFGNKVKHVYGGGSAETAPKLTDLATPTAYERSGAKSRIQLGRQAAGMTGDHSTPKRPSGGGKLTSTINPIFGSQFGHMGYSRYSRPGGRGGQIMSNPYRSGFSGIFGNM